MSASAEHRRLQRAAVTWLRRRATARGCPAGYEISLGNGSIADAVALCAFQSRFYSLYTPLRSDQFDATGGRKDAPEWACVFEVKVSRPDFLATFGPTGRWAGIDFHTGFFGSLRWIVAPRDVASEPPPSWGLLCPVGQGLTEIFQPPLVDVPPARIREIAYELLWYGDRVRPWKALATASSAPPSTPVLQKLSLFS
jgi:hypothetical protein